MLEPVLFKFTGSTQRAGNTFIEYCLCMAVNGAGTCATISQDTDNEGQTLRGRHFDSYMITINLNGKAEITISKVNGIGISGASVVVVGAHTACVLVRRRDFAGLIASY